MNPSKTDTPLSLFKRSLPTIVNNIPFIAFFWVSSSALMLISFSMRQGMNEAQAQVNQVIFELIVLFLNILFLHGLNCRKQDIELGVGKLLFEGALLTPGYILQTIFWILSVLLGATLLVVPGIVAAIIFYFSPVVAVIFPDYKGKVFSLSKEFFWPSFGRTAAIIISVALVTYFPMILHLGLTGQMESSWSWLLIPLNYFLYFTLEVCLFEYVYGFVKEKREALK